MHEAIVSSAYFPNISYLRVLKDHKKIIIDTGEHFIKQSHRNRSYVLGPNSILKLIVPLQKWKNNTPVKDIRIAYSENWQKLHWKTMESSYRSSPYFEYYEDKLDAIVNGKKHNYLVDLNNTTMDFILSVLKLDTEIAYSSQFMEAVDSAADFRNNIPGPNDKGNDYKSYVQVFGNSNFFANLSLLDLICNEGPNAIHLL